MADTLVITVEGARADLLGVYGADNALTPRLNELAARGTVLDRLFLDSIEPLEHLRSLWTGTHRLSRQKQSQPDGQLSIWQSANEAEIDATLVTDCREAAELAEQMGCRNVVLLAAESHDGPAVVAEDPLECAIVTPFLVASEALMAGELSGLVWLHSRGLRLPWDAPLHLRDRFRDPEDPSPPDSADPPLIEITRDTDPDAVVGWSQVAAAQIAVLDEAISLVMDAVESAEGENRWNFLFVGLGGVPLGEHNAIGWHGWGLHETHLACAAILLSAENLGYAQPPIGHRRAEICQLPDVGYTLARVALPQVASSDENAASSDENIVNRWGIDLLAAFEAFEMRNLVVPLDHAIIEAGEGDLKAAWVRTAAWSATFPPSSPSEFKLFVMPDDRWEVCDVASRRWDINDRLEELYKQFAVAAQQLDRSQVAAVGEELYNLMR